MAKIADCMLEGRHIKIDSNDFFCSSDWFLARRQILDIYGKQCMKCGRTREEAEIHVDHIYPRSIYPERALDIQNLQVLCKECNFDKSNVHIVDYRPKGWKDMVTSGGYIPKKLFSAFLPFGADEFYPLGEFEVLNSVEQHFEGNISLGEVRSKFEYERFLAYLISNESNILINRFLWVIDFYRHERCLIAYNKYLNKSKEYLLQVMKKNDSDPSKFFGLGPESFLRGRLVNAFGGVSINSLAYSVVRLKNNEIKHFYQ